MHIIICYFSLFLIEVFLLLVSVRIIDKIMQFTNALLHRVLFCMVSSGDCYMIFRVILGRRKKVINSFVFIVLLWIFCTVDFHFFYGAQYSKFVFLLLIDNQSIKKKKRERKIQKKIAAVQMDSHSSYFFQFHFHIALD